MRLRMSEQGQGNLIWIIIVVVMIIVGLILLYVFTSPGQARREAQVVSKVVIAGKVVNNQTNKWPNDRLVLLFLHNKEIARNTTSVGESKYSGKGIHDGLFVLEAENTYGLTMAMLNNNGTGLTFKFVWDDLAGYGIAYAWLDSFEEGKFYNIPIPEKNISYIVKVLSGDIADFSPALLIGGTMLKENGEIVVALPADAKQTSLADHPNVQIQDIIYDTGITQMDINTFMQTIDNCANNERKLQKYIQSQTFIHEYRQLVELPSFSIKIIPQLQTHYGYENGQIKTETINYDMVAEPYTKLIYTFTWQEVWETGVAKIISGNEPIDLPFQVKVGLTYKIDGIPAVCP